MLNKTAKKNRGIDTVEIALLIILLPLFAIVAYSVNSAQADYQKEQEENPKPSLFGAIHGVSPDLEINIPWYAFPLAILAGLGLYAFLVFFF